MNSKFKLRLGMMMGVRHARRPRLALINNRPRYELTMMPPAARLPQSFFSLHLYPEWRRMDEVTWHRRRRCYRKGFALPRHLFLAKVEMFHE